MALSDDQILDFAATTQLYNHALPAIRFARAIEAEARRDALEEAAKVAESEPRVWDADAPDPQHRIAAAIRKLKEDSQ